MAQEVPTLTLVIKNPAQSREFEVKINADASISVLKKILEESYPGNPVSFSQKLIFAGRLLNDMDILGDIFSQRKVTFITDLYCTRNNVGVVRSKRETNTSSGYSSSNASASIQRIGFATAKGNSKPSDPRSNACSGTTSSLGSSRGAQELAGQTKSNSIVEAGSDRVFP